jgi:hypothetical protein
MELEEIFNAINNYADVGDQVAYIFFLNKLN